MEIDLNGARLKVYEDGTIERLYKKQTGWKKLKLNIHTDKHNYKRFRISVKCKTYTVSRIMGYAYLSLDMNDKTQQIDHIDRNSLNNNLSNLRIVSPQQNSYNKKSKGYSYDKRINKYQVCISIDRKLTHIGLFDTEEEAKKAYEIAKTKYHII